MKKLIMAVASAMAVGFSAYAAENVTWFNGGVAENFPNATTLSGGAWANTDGQAAWDADAGAVLIEPDGASEPVTFTATAEKTLGGDTKSVTFNATLEFTPFDDASKITNVVGAKAGVAVVSNATEQLFYVLEKDSAAEPAANKWVATTVPAPANGDEVAVSIVITNGTDCAWATYKIGDADPIEKAVVLSESTSFSKVVFVGDSALKSLDALSKEIVCTLKLPADPANVKEVIVSNVTAGVAVTKDPETGLYTFPANAAAQVWIYAKDGYLFSNGKTFKMYEETMDADKDFSSQEPENPTEAPAKIGTVYYLTLQDAVDAGAGKTVEICKNLTLAERVNVGVSTTIDLGGFTVSPTATCANHSAFNITAGTVAIANGTIDATAIDESAGETDAITVRSGATLNLSEGLTVKINTKDGACVYAFAGALVNISGGTYENLTDLDYTWVQGIKGMSLNQANNTDQLIFVSGGQFRQYNPANGDDSGNPATFLANGYYSAKQGDFWVITDAPAAKIGTVYYLTLQDAVDAGAGKTVEICKNLTLAERVNVGVSTTIDLGGFTVSPTATCANHSAFNITAGTVAIANGTIDATAIDESAGETDAITVRSGATLNLSEGLTVKINTKDGACVYAFAGALVNISGGTYENLTDLDYTWVKGIKGMPLNQANNTDQLIFVSGGQFRQYNPANGDDSGNPATFLANGYYSAKQGDFWVITDAPAAKIGTVYYLTLNAAFENAVDGDTIELIDDTEADGIEIAAEAFKTYGVTLELGGKTLTFKTDTVGTTVKDCMTLQVSNYFEIANGTIAVKSGTNFRDIIRYYGHADNSSLTLNGVTLDGANLQAGTTSKAHSVLTVEGGNCTITGNGSITAPEDTEANTFYAIKVGNHAGATYSVGTLTVNGSVTGDILITGGTYVEGANADVDGYYYYGKNKLSSWEDANNTVFAARTGVLPATGAEDNFVGQLYKELRDAVSEVSEDDTLSLLKAAGVTDVETIDKTFSLDLNGNTFTVANGDLFQISNGAELDVKNSATDGTGGLVVVGDVEVDGVLDLYDLAYGAGGLIAHQGGQLVIGEEAKVTFMQAWSGISPNLLKAQTPGFMNAEEGAIVNTGVDYTYDGTMFLKSDGSAVAKATVTCKIVGTEQTADYLEAFDSLTAAIAAVKDGGTVTLCKNTELASRIEPNKSMTIDLGGNTITRPDGSYSGNGSAFDVKSGTVTIKNGAIDLSNLTQTAEQGAAAQNECDAITARAGASVTLEDLTVTVDSISGSCAYAFKDGLITIKSGTYTNKTTADYPFAAGFKALTLNQANKDTGVIDTQLVVAEGGTFVGQNPATGDDSGSCSTFVKAGYYSVKTDAGWVVTDETPAAKIGTVYYLTLQDAVDAGAGKTVEICKNLTLAERVNVGVSTTIDLGGFTVSPTATCANHSAFNITAGTVAIANGVIDATAISESAGETDAITVRSGATLNLAEGLTVKINTKDGACVYAFAGGLVNISGGTYENLTDLDYTWVQGIKGMSLNQANNTAQLIFVSGGQFRQYNPANGDDSGNPSTFLAANYLSEKIGDYWTVRAAVALTAVELDKTDITNKVDDVVELAIKSITPANADTNSVVWSSSNEAVATVEDGSVTMVGNGEATITVTVTDVTGGSKTATCKVTVEAAGPTPGSDTKITPVPGEENTYKVEPTGSSTVVAVDNVTPGDKLVVSATVTEIQVNEGEQSGAIIRVRNSGDTADIPNGAMYGWDGNSFGTALDPDGVVTDEETGDDIPVTPTIGEETEGIKIDTPFQAGDTPSATVLSIPGLTYQLMRSDEPSASIATSGEAASEPTVATDTTITLTDGDKPEGKAFYQIKVTK